MIFEVFRRLLSWAMALMMLVSSAPVNPKDDSETPVHAGSEIVMPEEPDLGTLEGTEDFFGIDESNPLWHALLEMNKVMVRYLGTSILAEEEIIEAVKNMNLETMLQAKADIEALQPLWADFSEEEIEDLTLEIANTRSIAPSVKDGVINEFYEVCLAQQYIAVEQHSALNLYYILVKIGWVAHSINARYRRYYNNVLAPRQQCRRCREAQLVNLVVYGKVLLDICVGRGDISLGLIVVVVGYVVLDGVVGEEAFKLVVQLCGECLIVAQNEGGAVNLLNDVCHCKGLSRARYAQQCLCTGAVFYSLDKLCDGIGLVAHWLIV